MTTVATAAPDARRGFMNGKKLEPSTVIGWVIQICVLVWGAATVKASVDANADATRELAAVVRDVQRTQSEHATRISVLEDREERRLPRASR